MLFISFLFFLVRNAFSVNNASGTLHLGLRNWKKKKRQKKHKTVYYNNTLHVPFINVVDFPWLMGPCGNVYTATQHHFESSKNWIMEITKIPYLSVLVVFFFHWKPGDFSHQLLSSIVFHPVILEAINMYRFSFQSFAKIF